VRQLDERLRALQDRAVGQRGLDRVDRERGLLGVLDVQPQVLGRAVLDEGRGGVDVEVQARRVEPVDGVGRLLAERLGEALDRRDLAVDPVAVGAQRARADLDQAEVLR
jgi:hypothetical protein